MKRIGIPGLEVFVGAVALTLFGASASWATVQVSAPDTSVLAGGAVIGALIVAKCLRQK